jgi:hypothetical protein
MIQNHKVYFVKRPSEKDKRKSFSIWIKQTPSVDGKRYKKFDSEQVDGWNNGLRAGLDINKVEREVVALCRALNDAQRKKEQGPGVGSPENLKLLDEYWVAEYSDRDIRRPETAFRDLLWAVNVLPPKIRYTGQASFSYVLLNNEVRIAP